MSGPNSGYEIISPITLGIPEQPVDLPVADQRKFMGVYTSLHTLLGALRDYAGIGNWSKTHAASIPVGATSYAGLTNRVFPPAGEAITTNDMVQIDATGKAMLATGSNVCGMMIGKDVAAGELCEVMMFFGIVKNFSGLTPGAKYYLGGTPGKLATSGSIPVGLAISSSTMFINLRL